jgi:hypothetical protein
VSASLAKTINAPIVAVKDSVWVEASAASCNFKGTSGFEHAGRQLIGGDNSDWYDAERLERKCLPMILCQVLEIFDAYNTLLRPRHHVVQQSVCYASSRLL